MKYQIIQGDNRKTLKTIPDNSIDAIVTDPPYGIDFLGKAWDANTGALETYQECLRVLKPGGHILAFSAARTYHHLAITLEQAGFEIRDQIMWIYSSGFPKSQDIGKSIQRSLGVKETKASKGMNAYAEVKDKKGREKWMNPGNLTTEDYPEKKDTVVCTDPEAQAWAGWGTQLKPAHEPIALARKPIKLSIAKNAQKYGTGALNIDATRIPYEDIKSMPGSNNVGNGGNTFGNYNPEKTHKDSNDDNGQGWDPNQQGRFPSNVLGEILQADYQKYFYCPKVSRKERHIGFDTTNIPTDSSGYQGNSNGGNYLQKKQNITTEKGNNHPTVKPIELMKYLIKLITPPGGTVLDPFNGSGSTGCAAVELGHNYIGCELDPAYVDIANRRIAAWLVKDQPEISETFANLFEQQ
jgi:site-specific DNA-methyltransferase (adenine-specific)